MRTQLGCRGIGLSAQQTVETGENLKTPWRWRWRASIPDGSSWQFPEVASVGGPEAWPAWCNQAADAPNARRHVRRPIDGLGDVAQELPKQWPRDLVGGVFDNEVAISMMFLGFLIHFQSLHSAIHISVASYRFSCTFGAARSCDPYFSMINFLPPPCPARAWSLGRWQGGLGRQLWRFGWAPPTCREAAWSGSIVVGRSLRI